MSIADFAHPAYQTHNAARLDHLASLGLGLSNKRVLEVGSGPGDHTKFYIDRNNEIVSIDSRQECVDEVKNRFPQVEIHCLDMNDPDLSGLGVFDIVHCYGLLYHLATPTQALAKLASVCSGLLCLETCVSVGNGLNLNPIAEPANEASQSSTGIGCRPTRRWVFEEMKKNFPFVYQPRAQPKHSEFPLDWTVPLAGPLLRIVLIGSRTALDETVFSSDLLDILK